MGTTWAILAALPVLVALPAPRRRGPAALPRHASSRSGQSHSWTQADGRWPEVHTVAEDRRHWRALLPRACGVGERTVFNWMQRGGGEALHQACGQEYAEFAQAIKKDGGSGCCLCGANPEGRRGGRLAAGCVVAGAPLPRGIWQGRISTCPTNCQTQRYGRRVGWTRGRGIG